MSTSSLADAPWYTPTLVMKLADGSILIKHGKPVQRATSNQTASWTGISKKNLKILAEIGYIRQCRPTPSSVLYYPQEVEAFIARTEADINFWTEVRLKSYLQVRRLREPRKLKSEKTQDGKTQDSRQEN